MANVGHNGNYCRRRVNDILKKCIVRWTREVCSLGGEEICQEVQKLPEPWSKPDLPGLPFSRAQPARANPPSFRIRCHRLAYNAEVAGTQNPMIAATLTKHC
jgi:hypothetical protein